MSHLNALAHCPGAFSNAFPKTTFQLQHDLWFSESDILFSKLIVLGSGTNRGSNISLCNSSWMGLYEGPVVCSNPVSENGRARLYQQSQEIMPARLELRAVWQTERALQKPALQTLWIKILKCHENTFLLKEHLWDPEAHSAKPITIRANIPSEFSSSLLFVIC